jgi:hypothetical protein
VRASLPSELVSFLDSEEPSALAADLRTLRDETGQRGWRHAVEGMRRSLEATGGLDAATVSLAAARAASGDERVEYDEEVDLAGYDRAFALVEGGDGDAA